MPNEPSKSVQITQLEHNLTNHPPKDTEIAERFEVLRKLGMVLGKEIILLTPFCREQQLALTQLEQTIMWSVAAIARHQEALLPQPVEPEPGPRPLPGE